GTSTSCWPALVLRTAASTSASSRVRSRPSLAVVSADEPTFTTNVRAEATAARVDVRVTCRLHRHGLSCQPRPPRLPPRQPLLLRPLPARPPAGCAAPPCARRR